MVVVPPRSPVEHFETLPIAFGDPPNYRALVMGGTLVAAAVVVEWLVADDTIVLLGIELDLDCPDEQPNDDCGSRAGKGRTGREKGGKHRSTTVTHGQLRSLENPR